MLNMEHIHIQSFRPLIFTTIRILVTIFVLNLLYQVTIRRYRRFTAFAKLPRLPLIGPVGWLIGNLDVYYYTMRHLGVEEGKRANDITCFFGSSILQLKQFFWILQESYKFSMDCVQLMV